MKHNHYICPKCDTINASKEQKTTRQCKRCGDNEFLISKDLPQNIINQSQFKRQIETSIAIQLVGSSEAEYHLEGLAVLEEKGVQGFEHVISHNELENLIADTSKELQLIALLQLLQKLSNEASAAYYFLVNLEIYYQTSHWKRPHMHKLIRETMRKCMQDEIAIPGEVAYI